MIADSSRRIVASSNDFNEIRPEKPSAIALDEQQKAAILLLWAFRGRDLPVGKKAWPIGGDGADETSRSATIDD